jgi:antibiotic biosynthesis monooxygenase (ABM) superfamily enzyme
MICRLWRGWTTPENAGAYEQIVRNEVIPAIEARRIPGFRHIDLMRREVGGEVEFQTLMWFDSLEAIKAFAGEDYERARYYPEDDEYLLEREPHVTHYEVLPVPAS